MVCDTRLREGQTISQRKEEVRAATEALSKGLAAGRIKVKIGPQGAVWAICEARITASMAAVAEPGWLSHLV